MLQQEEYDGILSIIVDRQRTFINAIYSLPPKIFYEVDPATKQIYKCTTGEGFIKSTNPEINIFEPKTDAVDKDVEMLCRELLEMSTNNDYLELNKIFFGYKREGEKDTKLITGKDLHVRAFMTYDEAAESKKADLVS